ncbi:MAG: D-amino acid aminotransferase [Clostridiales bacterium]|jgi:D-alanine transaminase|nr:D-amino acid aminotransferase [Clostridiales bacterium]
MKNLGYYNGKFDELDKMTVPFNDRVCFFGDGVYDATYSRNYKIYALDDHIDRFYNSAGLLDINLPLTKKEMKELLYEMVKKVETGDLFVYWQATRGTQIRNHSFDPKIKANIWIVLKPAKVKDVTKKMKVITAEDTRFLHCNIKTLNLLPSVMASQKAESIGCEETILHRAGRVTECAHSNVSILKDGKFITAPTDHLILPGITRMHIIKMCKKLGIPVDETPFTLDELFSADEVVISSAGQLAIGASEIDGKPVGGKAAELLKKIQDALMEEFYEETNI